MSLMPTQHRDRVFVSYSHKDKKWLEKFSAVLAPDIRNGRVDYWDDRELQPGDPWYAKILDGIEAARVAVLLVSPNFLASRFIMEEELPEILAARAEGLTIIWVPIFGTFYGPEAPPQLKTLAEVQAAFDAGTPLADQEPASQTSLLLQVCRQIARLLNPGRIPCNLPFNSLAELFKDRVEAFTQLDRSLCQHGSATIVQPQAIQGLGGIGKTRLAIEYAWRHQDDFTAFLFVSANTPDDLDRNLAALCRPDCLDLRERQSPQQAEQRDAVIRWLQQNRGWLLILDNVDTDGGVRAAKALVAKLRGGHVLITSRVTEWGRAVHPVALDVLPLDDAVALLHESAHAWRASRPGDAAQARMLAERLGCLPLALTHAAAYMQHHHQTFRAYLDDFERHFERLLAYVDDLAIEYETELAAEDKQAVPQETHTARKRIVKTLATTFFLSFDHLTPEAKAILQASAFLAPAPIPMAMFQQSPEAVAALVGLWCEETSEVKMGHTVSDALAALARYSLISRSDGYFSVHRMLQEKIIRMRVPAERRDAWAHAVAILVARSASTVNPHDPATWLGWEGLQPHAEQVWDNIKSSPHASEVANVPQALGLLCYGKGLYDRGVTYAQHGLSLYEASQGPEATETLLSLSSLADLQYKKRKFAEAEALFRRLVDGSVRVLGPTHQDTLMRRNGQALCIEMKDGFAASEPLYRATLADATTVLGENHPVTLDTADNFAGALLVQGQHAEAEPILRRVLAGKEQVFGENHWQTCITMNNLAIVLHALGKSTKAGDLYQLALVRMEKAIGGEHPDFLRALANYGSFLAKTDRTTAEDVYRRVLERRERRLGLEHPETLSSLNSLATLLSSKDDRTDLVALYRHFLEACDRELGPEHKTTAAVVTALSNLLYQLADDAGAEPLDRRIAESSERKLGAAHPTVARAWHSYGCTLRNLGRGPEAETAFLRALAAAENARDAFAADSPILVHWKNNLATALLIQDKLTEANQVCSECWQVEAAKKDVTAGRVLFVRTTIALLSGNQCQLYLGQLKTLWIKGPLPVSNDVPSIWRVPSVLAQVNCRLPQHADVLTALLDALNDQGRVPALEQFPIWRDQTPAPLDVP